MSKATFTERYSQIVMDAYKIVYDEGACFTLDAFAKRTGWKNNRHTRKALQIAVTEGRLTAYKMRFSDGHYRRIYFAPAWEGTDTMEFYKRIVAQREALDDELFPKPPVTPIEELPLFDALAVS